MTVIRVHKTANYTVMSNHHLRNRNLSLRAKGLISLMLSLPDDWDYSVNGLAAICSEGVKAIRTTLKEIEEAGYLIRTRKQDKGGRFSYDYDIYEEPQPQDPQPYSREGHAVEGTQINKELLNTETKEINKKDKIDKIDKRKIADFSTEVEPSPFSKELIKEGYIDQDDLHMQEFNDLFNETIEETSYEITRSALWYILKQIKYRNGLDENGERIQNKLAYLTNALKFNTQLLERRNKAREENKDHWLYQ